MLAKVLQRRTVDRALVFTRTKHGADGRARPTKAGIAAAAIHGNKSQNAAPARADGFSHRRLRMLVATDIAARGIDVDGISHVINFDLPNVPETYVHRIGRTARAGARHRRSRSATPRKLPFLRDIEKLIRRSIPLTDDRSAPAQHHRPAAQGQAPANEKHPIAKRSSQPRSGAGKQHHRDAQAVPGKQHHRDAQAAPGKEHNRDRRRLPANNITATRRRLPANNITAMRRRLPANNITATRRRLPAIDIGTSNLGMLLPASPGSHS